MVEINYLFTLLFHPHAHRSLLPLHKSVKQKYLCKSQ